MNDQREQGGEAIEPTEDRAQLATEVLTWTVTPGREEEFEAWAHGITEVASRHPGHLGAAWLRPPPGGHEYQTVLRFENEALLARWMSSPERAVWVAKLDGIATATSRRSTGLETWFSLAGQSVAPPPKWKMTVVTAGAIYPIVIVINWLVVPHVRGWPLLLRAALFPIVIVPLLTYVVMPRLSHRLRHWLYQRS